MFTETKEPGKITLQEEETQCWDLFMFFFEQVAKMGLYRFALIINAWKVSREAEKLSQNNFQEKLKPSRVKIPDTQHFAPDGLRAKKWWVERKPLEELLRFARHDCAALRAVIWPIGVTGAAMSSLSPRKLLSDDAEALLLNLFSDQPGLLGCEILFLRYKLEKRLRAVYLTDGDAMY